MNIEHKTEPVEHWIVGGKAYRLATEADVGKEVYRSDMPTVEGAIKNGGPIVLCDYRAGEHSPFSTTACQWRFAYVQDDSLLKPQRVPVPELGDGWFLLTTEDGEIQPGDKIRAGNPGIATWTDLPHGHKWAIATWIRDSHKAARYFGVAEAEPVEQPVTPIDWTKPVRTKDGRAVRVLCTDGPGNYPVVGFVGDELEMWTICGKFCENESGLGDLENIPPEPKRIRIEHWVNVYDEDSYCTHDTKEICDKTALADRKRFACVKIVIDCVEGEGL